MPTELPSSHIAGANPNHPLDALFVNAPLRDYSERPRVNDFTLPVLGMGYIATYAAAAGFNVGVLDAEAQGLGLGLGLDHTVRIINDIGPRWVGFNLLAPTYEISARLAAALDPSIKVMLGGHQAKAMPTEILTDPRMARCEALVIGEGETRVVELLADHRSRAELPGVMWLDPIMKTPVADLASTWNLTCVPHIACSSGTGIALAAGLHLILACENAPLVEVDAYGGPGWDGLLKIPLAVRDGYVTASDAPGIGVDLSPDAYQRFAVSTA